MVGQWLKPYLHNRKQKVEIKTWDSKLRSLHS